MKLLVAGSRGINPELQLFDAALELLGWRLDAITAFVSGLCPNSPDMLPFRYVNFYDLDINIETYPADWSKGRWAGIARNRTMAEVCDAGIVFWDSHSKGSDNMIKNLQREDKPYVEVLYQRIVKTPRGRPRTVTKHKPPEYYYKYQKMRPNGAI